jgi:hypothetical protein
VLGGTDRALKLVKDIGSEFEVTTERPSLCLNVMFLLARVRYALDNALTEIKGICKEWDVWNLYFKWGERKADTVLKYEGIDRGRIESASVIAVPFSRSLR